MKIASQSKRFLFYQVLAGCLDAKD